jgi:hypothetical protein
MMHGIHENFSRDETITAGSDRSFGIVMAGGFSVLALLNGWHGGKVWPLMAGIAILLLAAALLYPAVLNPLNRAWLKFGLLLHRLVSPIVMGLVFYGTVLPTGLVMRAMGKDLLRLKLQPDADSYWIVRQPPGPAPETMKDQF